MFMRKTGYEEGNNKVSNANVQHLEDFFHMTPK